MLTLNQALINLAITFGASGVLAALAYFIKYNLYGEKDKGFLKGTFLGSAKLLFIYLLIMPILIASPAPAGILEIFRLVLLGLVVILIIELFVYLLTHLIKTEKELFIIGIIGGITRSEAVIAEFLDELKESTGMLNETVLIILIASTTMIFRNMVILAFVVFELFTKVLAPLLFLGIISTTLIYFTYKKTEIEDITLKAVSLKTAFEIVFLFTIVTAIAQYLAGFGIPLLLYIVATLGALGGALPIVFSVITLLSFNQIDIAVGATMVVLASAVAYTDDAFLALLFKQRELAKHLFLKQFPLAIATILLYFFLTGSLRNISLPAGIPGYLYLAPIAILAVIAAIFLIKRRFGGGGGAGFGGGESGGGDEGGEGEDLDVPEEPEPEPTEEPESESKPEAEETKEEEQ